MKSLPIDEAGCHLHAAFAQCRCLPGHKALAIPSHSAPYRHQILINSNMTVQVKTREDYVIGESHFFPFLCLRSCELLEVVILERTRPIVHVLI